MKVAVDDSRCRGHGVCVALCPEVFTLTEDGYAVSKESEVTGELEDGARVAAQSCPEQAITLPLRHGER